MNVILTPHEHCRVYNDWHQYLQGDLPSAVLFIKGISIGKYIDEFLNATARNRYRYSIKAGYESRMITWEDRNNYLNDIYEVNTSAPVRQGREMSEGYKKQPERYSGVMHECPHHYVRFIGCFKDGKLVGYISAHFCGEMAAASQILGHAAHLKHGIMLNLWVKFIEECMARRITTVVYSRWKDGTDGLKYWKHSVGMRSLVLKEFEGAVV